MNENKGAIGRKRKKNGFTQISNCMFEDDRLSWKAKGLLGYLLSRPDNWKVNKADLQKRAKDGRDSMQNAIGELRNHGYLHIYPNRKENGKLDGWIWEYDDIPFVRETQSNNTEKQQKKTTNMQDNNTSENQQEIGENVRKNSSIEEQENHNTEYQQEIGENVPVFSSEENQYNELSVVRKSRTGINNKDFNNKDFNNTKDKKIKPKNNRSISAEIEQEFDELWKLYPKKQGKKKAFDAYKKARKNDKTAYKTVQNGLYRYLRYLEANGTEEQYIQHGSTWFNQEKWRDEYTVAGLNKKPKNALDYFRMKHGGESNEPYGNREVIDDYSEVIPEPF